MPLRLLLVVIRPGRLFWNENPKCWVAKIYLKVPKNRILMIRNRCAAGFPVLGLFWKCSRFVCLKYIIYRGLFSKKKIWSLGTTLGWRGGLILRGNIVRISFYFNIAQNRSIWPIFKGYCHRGYSLKVNKQQLRSKYFKTRWREVKSYLAQNWPKYYRE